MLPPLCSKEALTVYRGMSSISGNCEATRMAGLPAINANGVTTTCFYDLAAMHGNPAVAKYKAMRVCGEWRINLNSAGTSGIS